MYQLDLETLLSLLKTSSGLLEAYTRQVPGLRGRCHVEVTLIEGGVTSCVIRDIQGRVLSGEVALRWLYKKVLDWTYHEQRSPFSVSSQSPHTEPMQAVKPQQRQIPRITRSLVPRAGNAPLSGIPTQSPGGASLNGFPAQPSGSMSLSGIHSLLPPQDIPPGNTHEHQNGLGRRYGSNQVVSLQTIPRRALHPSPQQLQSWTRLQRSIFLLADGTHSIEVIARLLQQDQKHMLNLVIEMVYANILAI